MFNKLLDFFSKKKKVKVIIVGLDNSGKSTIIKQLSDDKVTIFISKTYKT